MVELTERTAYLPALESQALAKASENPDTWEFVAAGADDGGGEAGSLAGAPPSGTPERSADANDARPFGERPGTASDQAYELNQLLSYREDGYSAYIVAGIPGSGKTQLLDAMATRGETDAEAISVRAPSGKLPDGRVKPTNPGVIEALVIAQGKRIFVDASGEHYRILYPGLRESEITVDNLHFIETVASLLGGLVLLVDLDALWGSADPFSEGARQEDIALWILDWIRYLRASDAVRDRHLDSLTLRKRVEAIEPALPTLDIPILVLFSRADTLKSREIPSRRGRASAGRRLVPMRDSPFFLAHHALPKLHTGLLRRARHFRYDFVHSLAMVPGGALDLEACGVNRSLRWLFDPRRNARTLPTRFWIGVQRWFDHLTGRGRRWHDLIADGRG